MGRADQENNLLLTARSHHSFDRSSTTPGGSAVAAGVGLVVLAGISFAIQSILAKVAYHRGADVPTVLATRFLAAAAAVWIVVWWRGGAGDDLRFRQGPRQLLGFALLGALFITNALFGYLALARLPVGTATLLIYLFPALVVLWSRLFFGERLTGLKGVALALALVGCGLTVDPVATVTDRTALSWIGIAFALASAVSNSWYATLAAPLGRGVPGLTVAAYSLPVTAAGFTGWLITRGTLPTVSVVGWLACLGIGLLSAVAIAAFLTGAAWIGGSRSAIASTSEPATAVILGAVLLGEAVAPIRLAGGGCIVVAIVLLAWADRRGEDATRVPPQTSPRSSEQLIAASAVRD